MRWIAAILLTALVVAAATPAAQAARTIAPPGQSAIDEYLETVPSDSGNTPVDGTGPSGKPAPTTTPGRLLPKQTVAALRRSGADGRAAAVLAAATAPAGATRTGQVGRTVIGTPDRASAGVLSALASGVTGTGKGGSGSPLPAVLIAVVLGGFVAVLVRRRGGGAPA